MQDSIPYFSIALPIKIFCEVVLGIAKGRAINFQTTPVIFIPLCLFKCSQARQGVVHIISSFALVFNSARTIIEVRRRQLVAATATLKNSMLSLCPLLQICTSSGITDIAMTLLGKAEGAKVPKQGCHLFTFSSLVWKIR